MFLPLVVTWLLQGSTVLLLWNVALRLQTFTLQRSSASSSRSPVVSALFVPLPASASTGLSQSRSAVSARSRSFAPLRGRFGHRRYKSASQGSTTVLSRGLGGLSGRSLPCRDTPQGEPVLRGQGAGDQLYDSRDTASRPQRQHAPATWQAASFSVKIALIRSVGALATPRSCPSRVVTFLYPVAVDPR